MTETKTLPDQVISIHIAVPVQRVWDEITKIRRIQPALYDTVLECELAPGTLPLKARVIRVMGWFLFLMPRTTRTEYVDEQGC